jgi:predicted nucleic acid-binding protein
VSPPKRRRKAFRDILRDAQKWSSRKALKVFPDTNALLAMIVFPTDHEGEPTLAGEVKALYEQGEFELVLSRVTDEELREVIGRDFPEHRELVDLFLKPFEEQLTRWPTEEEVDEVRPYCVDPEDAPIFAAALLSEPDILLSNDFETFHTEKAKELWKRHGVRLESLYGLLCVFGKRERRTGTEQEHEPSSD